MWIEIVYAINNQKSYGIGKKPYKNQKDEYNPREYNYNFFT